MNFPRIPYHEWITTEIGYGNTLADLFISGVIFVLTILALLIFKIILKTRINALKKQREELTEPDPLLAQKIQLYKFLNNSFNKTSIFLISAFLSFRNLQFPPELEKFITFIIFGGLSFILISILINVVDQFLDYQEKRTAKDYRHITEFLKLMLKIVIITFILVWFMSNLGVNVNTFIAGFGVTGIAVALAMQTTISDLFASITLYFDKPFEIGDFVSMGSDSGTIEVIGLRSTQVRTPEGEILVISNKDLTTARIRNYKKMNRRRVVQTLGVDYDTPFESLSKIPKYIEEIVQAQENVAFDRCHITDLGSSTIDVEYVYYILNQDYLTYLNAKQAIILSILEKFENEQINMPYPTQRLFTSAK